MLMASIVASMMVGGFLLTVSGDAEDELSDATDTDSEDDDLYADASGEGGGGLEYADILQEILNEEAQLAQAPEEYQAAEAFLGYSDADIAEADAAVEAFLDYEDFEDTMSGEGMNGALTGTWTEDGTEAIVTDFVPGEDQIWLEYDANDPAPQIDLFGDPAGNALVFADGHLVIKVMGADGQVIPEDIQLEPVYEQAETENA